MNAALNVRSGVAAVMLALAIQSSATADTLISTGAVWKYLDDRTDQGTAWVEPTFDDSAWPQGPAKLGFGDGDEATLLNAGGFPDRLITAYFRHGFALANASAVSNLVLRVRRDDGVVLYLNGVEVFRDNMPPGPITYDTFATTVLPDESAFVTASISPGSLVSGQNVLAAEVHQINATSSDLGFDLELTAGNTSVTNPPAVPPTIVRHPQSQTVVVGSDLTLSVEATGTPPLSYRWRRNGVGITNSIGPVLTLRNVQTNQSGVYSVIVTNVAGMRLSSNAVVQILFGPGTSMSSLVARGSVWKYFEGGVQPGLEQGQDWTGSAFDDSSWSSGPAQLGHGDGDEATIVGQATNAFAKPIAVYFRREFNVNQIIPGVGLTLSVLRDDGAVVYLNGREVFRSNMPDGPVSFSTLATAAVGGAEESTLFISTLLSPDVLAFGRNVIAAEIHQNAITSSDLSFDLELTVGAGTNVTSTLSVVAADATASEIDPRLDQIPDPGVFRIVRSGPTNETVHVRYDLSGTASNGVDYAGLSGAIDIPAGATSVDIIVDVIDDLTAEADESVRLSLLFSGCIEGPLPGQGCYLLGSPAVATIVVHDNEIIPPGELPVVSVVASDPQASEVGILTVVDPGTFTFRRSGDLNLSLSVSFQLSGTASNGVDYQRITNRIAFAAGAAEARLNVNPIYDTLPEGQETIVVTLESPVCAHVVPPPPGCYVAGSPNQAMMTLVDFRSPTNQLPPTTLVSTGSVWKYIDTGANLGTAWRTAGYDDGAWPSGLAKFGFGEGNEATVLNVWSSNGQQVITYYFRHLFVVSNSAAISNLTLRLLRDDGAVVYLNGTEIRRDNMTAGNITYSTLASVNVGDTEERSYLAAQIPPTLLVPGVNVLAVEVHQASAVSGDLGFSLELIANAPAGLPLAVALDATNLVWTTGGDASWFGQTQTTRDGVDAAQSGHVPQGRSSWLETTVDGPGLLNYAFQVRTEHINSTFRLLVDGAVAHTFSLHLGWSGDGHAVPAGRHTLRWLLENPANGGGSAVAWLDEVVYVQDPASPPVITMQPLSRTNAVGETAFFTVVATGTPPLSYQWRRNDVTLPGATNATLTFHNVQTDHAGSYSVVVANIAGAATSSTAVLTVLSVPPTNPPPSVVIVTNGSLWKYLDTGEDLGSFWRETDFNDWYWPLGRGQLGYGDGDETTVIRSSTDPSGVPRIVTYYFRHAFLVEERAQFLGLTGRLLVDDGAVVYLNGMEVFRYNLPAGPITFNTLAPAAGENQVVEFPVPLELLNNGFNVFAVEVHQNSVNSSDVSFDLSVTAQRDPNSWPVVRLISPPDHAMFNGPTNLTLVAEASDPDGRLARVEFLQFTNLLGAIVPADGQTVFSFIASNVPPIGAHSFFARAIDDQGAATVSRVLSIGVVTYPIPPVVGVTAPSALVDEDPPRSASFVITRSPVRNTPLTVYFDLSGEAVNGEDFELVPLQITIPADASSAEVVISVIDDFNVEDVDPVTLTLRSTPPGYIPSFPPGPDGYFIDENQREATIRIEDDDVEIPPAVEIVTPVRGSTFVAPVNIQIVAKEFAWDFRIESVEFFANGGSLGMAQSSSNEISRNWSLVWSNPPPGDYSLDALSIDEFGRRTRAILTVPISVVRFIPPQCPWPVEWQLTLSNGPPVFKPTDEFKVVHPLPGGGYILGGESYTADWDYWAVRIDGQGRVLWNRLFGGRGSDQLFDLQPTSDGGFVLGGWSSSGVEGTKTSPNYGGSDFWVIRLDANGNQLWDRTFGGFLNDGIYGLQQTSDGGYILGGVSESRGGGNKTSPNFGLYDFWLVRLDGNGNKLWDQSYGGAKGDLWGKVRQTRDGGFVMYGTSESEPGGNKTSPVFGSASAWAVRTDADGNKLWDQSYGGNRYESLAGVAELADGALLFAGGSISDSGGNKTSPAFGEGDGFVLVLNVDGSKRRDQSIGGTSLDWFHSLAPTPDGGFLIGGFSTSPVSGNKTSPNLTDYDPWMVWLDAAGNKLRDRVAPGGTLNDARPTSDGGVIMAGQFPMLASGLDGWVQKMALLPARCDIDTDGDGVLDDRDQCPGTPTGAVVDADGCSLDQLCPCVGTWRNRGEYVRCAIKHAWQFFRAGLITAEQRREFIRNAIRSDCGKREHEPEPVQVHILPLTPEECRRDGFQLILSGDVDTECIIESSSDLEHWQPMQTDRVTITGSEIICPLDDARMRFFRLRLLH